MAEHFDHCLGLLREGDSERYLTVLFAPAEKRPALAALFAFDLEISRIRDLVSEPMPGEIRLQWWRDAVSGERDGEARQHPVGAAMLDAIEHYKLPRGAFENLLEARTFDLYHDPMPDRTALEGYLGETVSAVFQMSAQILADGNDPKTADAAGHAGVAYGISRLIRRLPHDRQQGRVLIPADILAAAGTDSGAWLSGSNRDAAGRAVSILAELGRDHLSRAEEHVAGHAKTLRVAFLPLAVVLPVLERAIKAGADAAETPVSLTPLRTQWRFMRRAIS
ncbi:phytoene/squalene synthase family protein [Oricola indica]|uniref:phytoene/squalene synthase family protein n=1 Tax=Oricola indica TaxID=2872591 RepID=UPI003CCBD759